MPLKKSGIKRGNTTASCNSFLAPKQPAMSTLENSADLIFFYYQGK